ncbi:MAG: hypothetical protein MK125_03230 [Dehalococcoidia bacterium]|nr:hypothetical protein [Dehalococcoidia bacterium]
MAITIGMGDFAYEYQADWAQLPEGTTFQRPSAVAVDSNDRVYVFQRTGPPVQVFDQDGKFLAAGPGKKADLRTHIISTSDPMTGST